MEAKIISRKQAKSRGLQKYFTGRSCKHGHISYRQTSSGSCCECLVVWAAKDRKINTQKHRDRVKRYANKYPDKIKARAKIWNSNNKALRVMYATNTKYKRLKAKPAWVDITAINLIYAKAKQLQKETNIKYHVDHIVPIQGKNVCGLHVPWNLQILSAEQNLKKGNKYVGA